MNVPAMRVFSPIERTFKSSEFAVSSISLPDESSARALGAHRSTNAKLSKARNIKRERT